MRADKLRIRIEKPNGASLTVSGKGDDGIHVFIEPREQGGMGVNLTDAETLALEGFLRGRRFLLEGLG